MTNEAEPQPGQMPTVVIYQNSDFVSGMLQEIFGVGILESSEIDHETKRTDGDTTTKTGGAKVGASAKVPLVGSLEAGGSTEFIGEHALTDENVSADRKKFVYSQAFYLDRVRAELRRRGLIRSLESADHADAAKAGDVVEFTGYFRANEVNAILDIATPDLIAAVTNFLRVKEGTDKVMEVMNDLMSTGDSIDAQKVAGITAAYSARAENESKLAAAVTGAIRADFRGDRTKEFYASVGESADEFTAVTVCEAEHFVTKDPDRLLDGRFVVLAKVISGVQTDVPVLAKNKLLNRLDVSFLDHTFQSFIEDKKPEPSEDEDDYQGDYFDAKFSAVVEGKSITVMPIAIYI